MTADEGFPWQLSVRIYPETVSFIGYGDSVNINGSPILSPCSVLKDNLIREISFCAVGADCGTDVNIFNLENNFIPPGGIKKKPDSGTITRDRTLQALNEIKSIQGYGQQHQGKI
jgi:hypothetical protein